MSITLSGGGYRYTITNQEMYSDNTPMLKVGDFDEMVKKADTMTIRHTSMAEFINAMLLIDAIHYNEGHIYNLILPYIPGARQDRSNPTGDVLFTLGTVARMLNERVFQRVVVLDPHSPRAAQLIHRMVSFPQALVIDHLPSKDYDGIIAPDKGAKMRALSAALILGVPVYLGGKTRDVSTGRLSGFTLEEIPQGHYLVVDDICDGGGTFIGLADLIKQQGSTADLFVTHGIFSKGTAYLRQSYKNIYTTDSLIPSQMPAGVTVLPVVDEMKEYHG